TIRVDDKADVKEPIGPILVACLGLRHDKRAPAAGEPPEAVGFGTGNIDRAGARELGVIDVENLVVKALQRAFGDGDKPNRNVEARQPERRLCQAFQMLQVLLDVLASANAPETRDQSYCRVRFDHCPPPGDYVVESSPSISHVTISMSAIPSTRRRTPRSP